MGEGKWLKVQEVQEVWWEMKVLKEYKEYY